MKIMQSIGSGWQRPSLVVFLAFVALLFGCAERPAPLEKRETNSTTKTSSYVFGGNARLMAQVTRTVAADGLETLHGETDMVLGTSNWQHFVEDVQMDRRGRLRYARIVASVRGAGVQDVRIVLDPSRDETKFISADGTLTRRTPSDVPWMYSVGNDEHVGVTPISAWVAARAAANGETVRLVDAWAKQSFLIARDQVLVETEAETVVVLGRDAADVDNAFVTRLRLPRAGITTERLDLQNRLL